MDTFGVLFFNAILCAIPFGGHLRFGSSWVCNGRLEFNDNLKKRIKIAQLKN